MKVEKKFIETRDGERIAAVIHHPEGSPKGSVLLQHGLFSDKEGNWERRADFFAGRGFTAVRFDRRGYGESDREFHEFNLTTGVEDSIAVMDHLEGEGEGSYAIYGSSFGGLIAVHVAASDPRVEALGLRAPATFTEGIFGDLREEAREKGGSVDLEDRMAGARMEMSFFEDLERYDAAEAAREIGAPTIILHGGADDVVPIEDSKRFYEILTAEKKFVEMEGEGHVFGPEGDLAALRGAADWFSKHLK